eukprot:CAMPEP_0197860028 /NCGR_PEP_ID=MMETSP1438-20131217/35103_1 /TAXON_ID=1461541 /ORGANISM="Pterosperma sp., Strain CCMP1384" /LENGTH=204 /DNA_ID=CAMNT_0043476731 /DNA_START=90 /DNA_END=704 /DNA_ORIENTATION=+
MAANPSVRNETLGSIGRTSFLQKPKAVLLARAVPRSKSSSRSPRLDVAAVGNLFGLGKKAKGAEKLCKDQVSTKREVEKTGGKCSVSFVGAEGQTVVVEMSEDEYILDQAEAAGVDLPATCRGGICGACVGRVVKGEVDQTDIDDLDFVLEPEQQDMGMAILCMSRPRGDCEIEAQCDWGNISMTDWQGGTFFTGEPVKLFKDG